MGKKKQKQINRGPQGKKIYYKNLKMKKKTRRQKLQKVKTALNLIWGGSGG